ncbi:MAG: hypothetical protein ACNI27_05185 [Desulfovibrio sp.]
MAASNTKKTANTSKKYFPLFVVLTVVVIAAVAFLIWNSEQDVIKKQADPTATVEAVQPPPAAPQPVKKQEPVSTPAPPVTTKPPVEKQTEKAPSPPTTKAKVEKAPITTPPVQDELVEDDVFSLGFVDAVAQYMVDTYHPAGTGSPARTEAVNALTFKGANMKFSLSLEGINHSSNDDIRSARQEVQGYLMQPGIVKKLGKVYTQYFMSVLLETAASTEKTFSTSTGSIDRLMTDREIAHFFQTQGKTVRDFGAVFQAIVQNRSILKEVSRYHQAARRVEMSNALFQDALNSSRGNRTDKTVSTGNLLKESIKLRESQRNKVIADIRQSQPSITLPDENVFYIAAFIWRRANGNPENLSTIQSAAMIFKNTGQAMMKVQ